MKESFESLLERKIEREVSRQVEEVWQRLEESFAKQVEEVHAPSPLMSRHEVAEFLGVSYPTLHAMMNSGKLKFQKVGRSTRFRRRDVEMLVKSGRAR